MPRTPSASAHRKVLEAALELVAERGVDATSMDAVAQKSGVSKATIYKHWADKDGLLLEMLAEAAGVHGRPEFDSGHSSFSMPIEILPDELASKIAAGEVIERPASVVKELIENSIDAHAQEIKLEVRGGGQRLIRVMDDGDGIPSDQVALAFARHATSKLRSIDDLSRLDTLGFRGEALPSIASVARVTLITRARDEQVGSFIRIDGGRILEHHPHGAPVGSVITVEDLFEHVPARLKFLKAATTESAQIAELIGAYAMAYPHLRFSLVTDGRLAFQTAGSGKLRDVLVKVFGFEVAKQMLEADAGNDEIKTRVSGFISPPAVHRSTRKYLFLFVNGRWIEDRSLAHAITEAYHTALMVGRFPIAVLNIALPTDEVDVNVHPAKSQVRFSSPPTLVDPMAQPAPNQSPEEYLRQVAATIRPQGAPVARLRRKASSPGNSKRRTCQGFPAASSVK